MNTPRRKLTRRQAWRKILKAYEQYESRPSVLSSLGLCHAAKDLHYDGRISDRTHAEMRSDIDSIRPAGRVIFWWAINASGARSRRAAIRRILRRMK